MRMQKIERNAKRTNNINKNAPEPKTWKVTLPWSDILYDTKEYFFEVDGKEYFGTIQSVEDGVITLAVDMQPGFLYVMTEGDEGGTSFKVEDITDFCEVNTVYVKTKRSPKTMGDELKKYGYLDKFQFSFPSAKDPSKELNMTIFAHEFVAIAFDIGKEKPRTVYGEITDISEDKIFVKQYVASAGRRSFKNIEIDAEKVHGMYRYQLDINEVKDEAV